MDRRDFLQNMLAEKPAIKPPQPITNPEPLQPLSGVNPYAGSWTRVEAAHLAKRTLFGAPKAAVDALLAKGPGAAVDAIMNVPSTPIPGPIKNYHARYLNDTVAYPDYSTADPDFNIADGSPFTGYTKYTNPNRLNNVRFWITGWLLNQQPNIAAKMYLFWHNHFATELQDIGRGVHGHLHHKLLMENCLGNFKDLVRKVTLDPAMLIYLNGQVNTKDAPDENYGRELQELFTLGKENNPNYTEADVKAAARVLTGWQVGNSNNAQYATAIFTTSRHDTGNKVFSSFYGNTTIAGNASATGGAQEIDKLLDMIFLKADEVARFMVRRFYRWFCYYKITPQVEADVIIPLANLFKTTWEIKPVITALLKSEHFFDPLIRGAMIKSPADYVLGNLREFNFSIPTSLDHYSYTYPLWNQFYNQMNTMGQIMGAPPNVAGWPAYYQTPFYYESWINADSFPKRKKHTDNMMNPTNANTGGYTVNGNQGNKRFKLDPVAFNAQFGTDAGDPNKVIDRALEIMYSVPLSDAKKQKAKTEILLSNQTSDYYWTNAWKAWTDNPNPATNATNYTLVYNRLATLYTYLMNLPEYQLM